ncbi:uncharacterized protein LOC108677643 [Hyalella azteca]|uniref:Uncharacterized protein LOC108677643 n=1 Tax=Hyalella azteca TaxID=294128 RepID=A0A8B7P5Q4_HYAAZ|nr:uncharacterized protein LOC108677643 [Hyalella azteca]
MIRGQELMMMGAMMFVLLMVSSPVIGANFLDYDEGSMLPWPVQPAPGQPSMRLRFGKRGSSLWGLTQRSMPSLRMRFGKRDWMPSQLVGEFDDAVQEDDVGAAAGDARARRDGSRSHPGMRLRFGKRQAPQLTRMEDAASTQQ